MERFYKKGFFNIAVRTFFLYNKWRLHNNVFSIICFVNSINSRVGVKINIFYMIVEDCGFCFVGSLFFISAICIYLRNTISITDDVRVV
jgi:hypothetical protein